MEKAILLNFLRNKKYSSFKLAAQHINTDVFIKSPSYNAGFSDKNYESCNLCCGTGFIKNYLTDVSSTNYYCDTHNQNSDNITITPYKLCISCHGTGKTDYHSVFYHTCCQKNTNTKHK